MKLHSKRKKNLVFHKTVVNKVERSERRALYKSLGDILHLNPKCFAITNHSIIAYNYKDI